MRALVGTALSRIPIPSGGPSLPARRPIRLLALVAVRDESRYLPGLLANLEGQVDGIVALDDGSRDGSLGLLEASPLVLETLRAQADRRGWDEVGNHRRLVAAGLALGADWLIALDADERVEVGFRSRVERVIRRGALIGLTAYSVRLRELWDSADQYRVDGIWSRKAPARLFRGRADHEFDERPLHASKAPLQGRRWGRFLLADLNVYHLRMIRPVDRIARRARFERLDPTAQWQPVTGYAYLTDETGLRLRTVSPRRGYLPEGRAQRTARPGRQTDPGATTFP